MWKWWVGLKRLGGLERGRGQGRLGILWVDGGGGAAGEGERDGGREIEREIYTLHVNICLSVFWECVLCMYMSIRACV